MWRHRLRVAAVVPEADRAWSPGAAQGGTSQEMGAEPGQFFRWRSSPPRPGRHRPPVLALLGPPTRVLRHHGQGAGGRERLPARGSGPRHTRPARGPVGSDDRQAADPALEVLLIAGGVGHRPDAALFESLGVGDGRLTLLYRASRPRADVVFRDELEDIARRRGAEIVWMVGPSSAPALRLTGATLRRLVPDVAERDVYLCASPGLSAAVRTALREAGLPRRRLHEEAFAF